MIQYFLRRKGTDVSGPFTSAQLRNLARNGEIASTDAISADNGETWIPAPKVRGIREFLAENPLRASAAPIDPPSEFAQASIDLADHEPQTYGVAEPVTPPLPHASTSHPSTSRAPATPARGASRWSAPAATPTLGLADRILRGAFRFARSISVLIILLCAIALIVSGIGALYAIAPNKNPYEQFPEPPVEAEISPVDPLDVPFPTAKAFIAVCSVPDRPETTTPKAPTRNTRITASEPTDPCDSFSDAIAIVLSNLQLNESTGNDICNLTRDLPRKYQQRFLGGFTEFAQSYAAARPTDEDCDGVDAARYYIQQFKLKVTALEEEQAAEQLARTERMNDLIAERLMRIAEAELDIEQRKAILYPSVMLAGSAVAALLIFLVLPLLIQIERNTRSA
ncbi:MAG: hypothetical protein EXS10_07085 [Phycisphaerales bacterium]|nr:hypothetical protein [Phycisphaerales bacterium]